MFKHALIQLAHLPTPVRIGLTLFLMSLMAVLSLTPGNAETGDSGFVWLVSATPSLLQKIMHVGLYATLASAWLWTLRAAKPGARFVTAFAIAFGFGVLMEWLQISVPGRFGSLTDVMLNGLGATLGLLLAPTWLRLAR